MFSASVFVTKNYAISAFRFEYVYKVSWRPVCIV